MSTKNPTGKGPARPSRDWSADEKINAVFEAASIPDETLGALLRERGWLWIMPRPRESHHELPSCREGRVRGKAPQKFWRACLVVEKRKSGFAWCSRPINALAWGTFMSDTEQGSEQSSPLMVVALLIVGALGAVVFLSGIPGSPTPVPPGSSAPGQPGVVPLSLSSQSSNNLRSGSPFRLRVHTRSQVGVMMLGSSNLGPSLIGPYPVDLSSDWFVLNPWQWTGGGNQIAFEFTVPFDPGLVSQEFVAQSVVMDPLSGEIAWTNSAVHRVASTPIGTQHVLLLKQTTALAEAPFAPAEAERLATSLRGFGHTVTVVDDALPQDLADFDCILDCRFTLPPAEAEHLGFLRFLQRYGGVFLLSGPYAGSSWGQLRLAWIQSFLTTKLGLPLGLASGGNTSGTSGEIVSPLTDPWYLQGPSSLAGLPYHVREEGGTFGPVGYQPVGTPWITDPTGAHVYGMLFRPASVATLPIEGRIAVLFNGASDALSVTSENPHANLVFANLVWWLDV